MSQREFSGQDPEQGFEELYAQAVESKPLLERFGNDLLDELRQEFPGKFEDAEVQIAETKDKARAEAKINNDYGGECAEITDLTRGRIVVNSVEEADLARQYVKEHDVELNLQKIKDRFENPTVTNYRDVLTTTKLENGHVAEFRIEHSEMIKAGDLTHLPYEALQDIKRNNKWLTEEHANLAGTLRNDIRDTHQYGADQAGLAPLLGTNGLKKMERFDREHVGQEKTNGYFDKPFELTQEIANELSESCLLSIQDRAEYLGVDNAVIKEALALRSAEDVVRNEEKAQQDKESLEATEATENRFETIKQEAAEARALADQKSEELAEAQTLADLKNELNEDMAKIAGSRIEDLEYSSQLLKYDIETMPSNLAETSASVYENLQSEIKELKMEMACTLAEAEGANQAVETAKIEQQEAEAKALEAEAAHVTARTQHQEEQSTLGETKNGKEAQETENTVEQNDAKSEQVKQDLSKEAQEIQETNANTERDQEVLVVPENATQISTSGQEKVSSELGVKNETSLNQESSTAEKLTASATDNKLTEFRAASVALMATNSGNAEPEDNATVQQAKANQDVTINDQSLSSNEVSIVDAARTENVPEVDTKQMTTIKDSQIASEAISAQMDKGLKSSEEISEGELLTSLEIKSQQSDVVNVHEEPVLEASQISGKDAQSVDDVVLSRYEDDLTKTQSAEKETTSIVSQDDQPVSADKLEVLETLEHETAEEGMQSFKSDEGRVFNEEEVPVQKVSSESQAEVDHDDSAVNTKAMSAEAAKTTSQDFSNAATQVTEVRLDINTGGGGGGMGMCFISLMPIPFVDWRQKITRDTLVL